MGGRSGPGVASAHAGSRWRVVARVVAILSNSTMVVYIYLAHLVELDWDRFGRLQPIQAGHSDKLSDYLRRLDFDPAFEYLRGFTFSEAMLSYLNLYLLVGAPVAVVLAFLEHGRVRWLQALAAERLPAPEASRASGWLELYLWALATTLTFVVSLGFFHIEMPFAHYCCAACAMTFGCASMAVYLLAPLDFRALAQSGGDPALAAWSRRVLRWVRPCLKVVLVVHLMAVVAGAWKVENLGNDAKALLFGIVETAVILGYQVFQGVMVVDDFMMGRRALVPHDKEAYRPLAEGQPQAEAAGASARAGAAARDGKAESPRWAVHDRLAGS